VKLQLRAIGNSADIDQFVSTLTTGGLRLIRVQRALAAREPGVERAYIDIAYLVDLAADDIAGSAA
jgi:hypothetical protein